MPQLDFANPLTTSTLVWLFIIFGVLYFLLKTYALPRVESVLEQRAARIREDLDAAREAQVAGEAALAEVRAATAQARAEAARQKTNNRLNAEYAVRIPVSFVGRDKMVHVVATILGLPAGKLRMGIGIKSRRGFAPRNHG